jgi:hypothetical protein
MQHNAFVIEAQAEEGIEIARAWVKRELGMKIQGNPDVVILQYGLFSVEDARAVCELASGAPFAGEHKVVIIAASRVYHEAQNALLKLFEEPPLGTYLFLVLPTLGSLLPTLRSRVQVLDSNNGLTMSIIPEAAEEFMKASKEKRSAIIKKLTSGKDEEQRRENREEAITILNGIEASVYETDREDQTFPRHHASLLSDIATLRGYLYERSAPVRMILEHLSLVIAKDLV